MALFLSCLANDPKRMRAILDRLRQAGWRPADIAVLHPEDGRIVETTERTRGDAKESAAEAAMVGGGSAAMVAGAFGWLVGYGVLAIPAAVFGAALGGAAGAALGAGADEEAALRRSLLAHYAPHISGTRSAIVVTADDARGYDTVMRIFRREDGRDIQVVGKGRLEAGGRPA